MKTNLFRSILPLSVLALFGFARPATAQLASSTFDTDADGWIIKDIVDPNADFSGSNIAANYTPVHYTTGGNPSGYISELDPSANTYYWYAPQKFLGDKHTAYGGAFSFDMSDTPTTSLNPGNRLVFRGGGIQLAYDFGVPATVFTHIAVNLTETGWRVNNMSGAAATQAQLQSVLANLSDIFIMGDFQNGGDTSSLDNVILYAAADAATVSGTLLFGGITALAPSQNVTFEFRPPNNSSNFTKRFWLRQPECSVSQFR